MAGQWYSLAVLLGGLALLMLLVVRGKSIFVVAPLCAALTVTLSGADPVSAMTGPYMSGFAEYLRNFYLIFALGAAFGRIFEESGAARVIAQRVGKRLGPSRAALAVVLACAVLTYGGVSLFVVGFSVYPLAVELFRAGNLPRRFIPAAIAFGSVTFTMTSAGSPEIQNLIPIKYLIDSQTSAPLTDARAGWPVSLIVAALMFLAGQIYLDWSIRREVARGLGWEDRAQDTARRDPAAVNRQPSLFAALLPLVVTLLALNAFPFAAHQTAKLLEPVDQWPAVVRAVHALLAGVPEDPTLSIFLGVVTALVTLRRHFVTRWTCLGDGFLNGLLAIGATASVVGFGAAVKGLPGFQLVVEFVTSIPGDPLIGAAIAVAVISGIAGSASGGQGIALPIIKPIYVDELGVAPRALHRVVSIASGSLDSLPANGYLVMLIRNICGETYARAYGPVFVLTVVLPAVGTAVALALFRWFPTWARM